MCCGVEMAAETGGDKARGGPSRTKEKKGGKKMECPPRLGPI